MEATPSAVGPDRHPSRPSRLQTNALRSAERRASVVHRLSGRRFAFEDVTIIGDTPLDVDCARACGAMAVAVATGFHPAEDLKACAPDLFFTDLSDVPAVVAALTGPR